jgi:type IV secretory pathway protease TraF
MKSLLHEDEPRASWKVCRALVDGEIFLLNSGKSCIL